MYTLLGLSCLGIKLQHRKWTNVSFPVIFVLKVSRVLKQLLWFNTWNNAFSFLYLLVCYFFLCQIFRGLLIYVCFLKSATEDILDKMGKFTLFSSQDFPWRIIDFWILTFDLQLNALWAIMHHFLAVWVYWTYSILCTSTMVQSYLVYHRAGLCTIKASVCLSVFVRATLCTTLWVQATVCTT